MSLNHFSTLVAAVNREHGTVTLEGIIAGGEPQDCCRFESDGDRTYVYCSNPVEREHFESLKWLFEKLSSLLLIKELRLDLTSAPGIAVTVDMSGYAYVSGLDNETAVFSVKSTLTCSTGDETVTCRGYGTRLSQVKHLMALVRQVVDALASDAPIHI
jgi:hypothetical protein